MIENINKEHNFISAVVYIRNNKDDLELFLKSLNDILHNNFHKYEIIFVDDASIDDSATTIKNFYLSNNYSPITIINMSFYQGIEASINAGVDLAIGDFVFEFDSIHINYSIDTILEVYKKSLSGFDIVNACPKNSIRKSSKTFYKIFNKYSNNQYNISTNTFRILSRRAINRINSMNKYIPYRKAVYSACGLKSYNFIYENKNPIPYNKNDRHINFNRNNTAINSLILFTNIAYRISLYMAFIMMIFTIFMISYSIFIFFTKNASPEGWTTTMIFLSISFLGIFAILAIIIKYLSILIDLSFKNNNYVISSIDKINK